MTPPKLTRRALLATTGGLATGLAGCSAFEEQASFPTGDWPQVGRDATNTAYLPDENVPSEVTEAWTHYFGAWPYTSPVVGDGRVFMANQNTLTGIAVVSGEPEFNVKLPQEPGGAPAYDSTNSTVYLPTYDRTTDEDGAFVHAFDVTSGQKQWSLQVGPEEVYALTLRDGTIYVRASESVVALEAGDVRWRYDGLEPLAYPEFNLTESSGLTGNVAPAVTAETVFAPSNQGVLALNRKTGARRWQKNVTHPYGVSVDEHGVYCQGYTQLRAFTLDGEPRWTRDDIGGISAPTLTGEAVYAKDGDTLHELDPKTGETRWQFDLRTTFVSSPSPVLEDAVIAPSHRTVAIRRGNGLDVKLNGREYWETEFDPAQFAAPAIGAGRLFLVDPFRNRLVALKSA